LTVAAVSTASFWLLSSWRPSIDWKHAEFRKIWHFSANLTGFNIAMFFERNADNMLVGRFLGAGALGWYSLAYNIMLLPLQHLTYVLNRALFPIFARQDREKMRHSYLRMLSTLALISTPAVCGLWAIRMPLVQVVLGEKWLPVAEILAWLAPTALLQCFTATLGPILMAIGRTDIMRNFSLIFVPLSLAAFVCGLPFGVAGVAAAYFLVTMLTLIPAFYFTLREIDLGLGDLAAVAWRPVVIGLAMAALVALTDAWVMPQDTQALLRLAILVPAGAGFYLTSVVLLAPDLLVELKEHLWHRS
jgi:PST family polysaccharide transporter